MIKPSLVYSAISAIVFGQIMSSVTNAAFCAAAVFLALRAIDSSLKEHKK